MSQPARHGCEGAVARGCHCSQGRRQAPRGRQSTAAVGWRHECEAVAGPAARVEGFGLAVAGGDQKVIGSLGGCQNPVTPPPTHVRRWS